MILQNKEESSSPQPPTTTTTMHIRDSVSSTKHAQQPPSQGTMTIPDIDPPPYSTLVTNNPSRSAVVPTSGVLANATTMDTIQLETHRDSITGTYIIDPNVSTDEPSILQDFVARHSILGMVKAFDFQSTPHAMFRSRFGSISLTLATKGSSERCHRTIVDISTRHGDIVVDFCSVHPGKSITLKVTSRKGNIVVLLPRSFYGDVQIRASKLKGYSILPGLSSSIRSMKGERGKASLRVGDCPSTSEGNSICQLSSGSGKIILGLSGEDSIPMQQRLAGIRAKIGAFFRGIGS